MRLTFPNVLALLWLLEPGDAFVRDVGKPSSLSRITSKLQVSIGLGPEKVEGDDEGQNVVEELGYEIPDHEAYRTSRRSKIDEQCDKWFGALLGTEDDKGILGSLADDARKLLLTPVPLVNEVQKPLDDEEWTPYVSTKLPWTPLTPAFGLEEFGLPTPRRNAETWRHFDVSGMVGQDYSGSTEGNGLEMKLNSSEVDSIRESLERKGTWLDDDRCQARLVYINGRFSPQLSKTNEFVKNIGNADEITDEIKPLLSRLTDGFTDKLAVPVSIGEDMYCDSLKKMSMPHHSVGEPTSQFAINTQQGSACFAALNTRRTGAVAYVGVPAEHNKDVENPQPILVLNAVTRSGGAPAGTSGVSFHPRCLFVAGKGSSSSIVQSCVDLEGDGSIVPKLYNGYTQFFIHESANATHSFLEESGGIVTGGVEIPDDMVEEGAERPREIESKRAELKDTHLETIDVQLIGDDSSYKGAIMSVGGSGRVRFAHSVSLLRPGSHAAVNGFSLSGGAQRTDVKTNIHHMAQGTTSKQLQKNMIGGRATGAFRGRIRVEQSAQQTDSNQLSRTVLLSDKSRAWAVPSLEIIADDVQCTHGTTVSDLSEEELFYLRARGLDRSMARNLLMYGFVDEICSCVEPSMLEALGSDKGLQKRVIERLQNLVPRGDRVVRGEFQSI